MSETILTKICTQCNINKPLTDYYKFKRNKDGLGMVCKACCGEKEVNYKRTKKGMFTRIYSNQRQNSRRRGDVQPNYNLAELREWAYSQPNFDGLYDAWVDAEYHVNMKPSCDRLNDYKPYTFDNLQLITWGENNVKRRTDMINGINNKKSVPVNQYDMDGNFIKAHYSQQNAARLTGTHQSHIWSCCIGERNHTGGYKWAYADS